MAFVNEKITREEDINLFNSFHLKTPITNEVLIARKWTVDRERERYFILCGGQNSEDIPLFFVLIFNKNKIYIEANITGNGDINTGIDSFWKISQINIPKKLEIDQNIILEYLKEAIYGYEKGPWNDAYIKSLKIEIISEPIFVN